MATHEADGAMTTSASAKDPHEPTRKCRRGLLVARVEVQLAATRLRLRKVDVVPEPLEDADGRDPRLREKRVVETREEERDAHGRRMMTDIYHPHRRDVRTLVGQTSPATAARFSDSSQRT